MVKPRLKEKYDKEIIPKLKAQMQLKSVMQVPRLEKICVNQCIGAAVNKVLQFIIRSFLKELLRSLLRLQGKKQYLQKLRKLSPTK